MADPATAQGARSGNPAAAFVYVAGPPAGPYKVGVATSPNDRLIGLQVGNPYPLSVIHSFRLTSRDEAFFVERDAHWLLRERALVGEWFDVASDEAANAVSSSVSALRRGEMLRLCGASGAADGILDLFSKGKLSGRHANVARAYRHAFETGSDPGFGRLGNLDAHIMLRQANAAAARRTGCVGLVLLKSVAGLGHTVSAVVGYNARLRASGVKTLTAALEAAEPAIPDTSAAAA